MNDERPEQPKIRQRNFRIPLAEQIGAAGGPPAYIRRELAIEHAERDALRWLAEQRFELLGFVTRGVKWLVGQTGAQAAASRFAPAGAFERIHVELSADPRFDQYWVSRTPASERQIAARSRQLVSQVARFNLRWPLRLAERNLGPLDEAVRAYNEFYAIEREAFSRFTQGAWRFVPREP